MISSSLPIPSEQWRRFLVESSESMGAVLTPADAVRFEAYALELLAWNRKINITAITDPKAIAVKHFVDSLVPAAYIPEHATVLDIGSGGGFPGIPLGIHRPDLRITLVDSSRKRVNFQRAVLRKIRLENVTGIEAKLAELVLQDEFRESFDVVISRAFTSFERWMIQAMPLVKRAGRLIAMVGAIDRKASQEIQARCVDDAIDKIDTVPYTLPLASAMEDRHLVVAFRK
jgi:16S rRNA (guanine527-N7)-methyltransferase